MIALPHQQVENLTNVESNKLIVSYFQKCLYGLGLEIYLPDYKWNWRFVLLIVITHPVIVSFFFLVFSDAPIAIKLEALCVSVIMWQGAHKFWSTFLCSKYYCRIFKQLDDLNVEHTNNPELANEFKTICYYFFVICEILIVCYTSVALAYFALPIFMWIKFHVLVTIIPIPLPIINWHEPIGYIINILHQIWLISYGLVGIVTADLLFLYQILHAIGYLKVFNYRVTQLNDLIKNNYLQPNIRLIEAQLYESIKAHQDYIAYIENMDGNYAQVCLGQLMTTELGLTLAIFMTVWSGWIIGPFMAFAAVFQLLEYCILGTIVTIQNEKASEIIYGMSWYLLPVRLQRIVVLMIARGQRPAELNVGGFAKLNVETAMQVIKATYSYLMMMLESIN